MSPAISVSRQRCFHHGNREAVARCPECGRFFCRECVTEHEQRVLCAACLRELARTSAVPHRAWARILQVLQTGLGLLTAWLFFYCLGQALLSIDATVHEGTVWTGSWWEEP
jgi:hypothetical protein